MQKDIESLSNRARAAAQKMEWDTVAACARDILSAEPTSAEGHFLFGLSEKVFNRPENAIRAFQTAIKLDDSRYDAAIELAHHLSINRDGAGASALLDKYESSLQNSPRYLDLAGTVFTNLGLWERAWPLYERANELQPNTEIFVSNLAHCASTLGKISLARDLYMQLLRNRPYHQRNHYNLSRLERATDFDHVYLMKKVLEETRLPPERNVFLYYALGKELEDLEQWEESFEYYKRGGDAITSVSTYDLQSDLDVIEAAVETCDHEWIAKGIEESADPARTPIFIIGLPRTGTTLTERILSSHSQVESAGETQFIEIGVRKESGIQSSELINGEMIRAFRDRPLEPLRASYLGAVDYLLEGRPYFIDKLPYNFIYTGFLARTFPDAPIVHVRRNPMDACFAMYKQVFTWAYRCSYNLDDLGRYYVAYHRSMNHWRKLLGPRLIEVDYESLVSDQERETRRLLDPAGLEFEPACLDFHANKAASGTASSVQIREKVHTRSVNRWERFAEQLEPLRRYLEEHGVEVPPAS